MEKIAVLMTAYNESESDFCKALDSICNQTYKDLHIYLLLDKPDNDLLDGLCSLYASNDNRISYIKNEQNLGLVNSLNKLLNIVTEDYVARMDADDVAELSRFEYEMQFMKKHNLDFVTTEIDYIRDDKIEAGLSLPNIIGQDFADAQKEINLSAHPTWLVKKEVYDKLRGYRNLSSCEDLDFVLRALQSGFRLGRLGKVTLHYRLRLDGISYSHAYEQYAKTKVLMDMYRKGENIELLDVELLNRRFSTKKSASYSQKYAISKALMESDVSILKEDSKLKGALMMLLHLCNDSNYRNIFRDILKNKKALKRIKDNS